MKRIRLVWREARYKLRIKMAVFPTCGYRPLGLRSDIPATPGNVAARISQNISRNEICPTLAPRADVIDPNAAFVCCPVVVLKIADVFTPENCVWLNAL